MKKERDIKGFLYTLLKVAVLVAALEYIFFVKFGYIFGIYMFKPTPEKYVRQSIMYIDAQAINAADEEWTKYKDNMLQQAKKFRQFDLCYDMLDEGIKIAGGNHSEFVRPDDVVEKAYEAPTAELKDDGVMYIKLPEFAGSEEDEKKYADTVRDELRAHSEEIKSVILDLRGAGGSKIAPMIGAVSPLLPDGDLMFYNVREENIPVNLAEGVITGSSISLTLDNAFKIADVPVAILQDSETEHAGEAVRICFWGNKNASSFGAPTSGYCICNSRIKLYDEAQLVITVGKYAANDGNTIFYEDPIAPDVETDTPYEAALEWIQSR